MPDYGYTERTDLVTALRVSQLPRFKRAPTLTNLRKTALLGGFFVSRVRCKSKGSQVQETLSYLIKHPLRAQKTGNKTKNDRNVLSSCVY